MIICQEWYNEWYKKNESKQNYPNEELCRFLSRCFSESSDKSKIRVLEVGCGQGANLLYIDSEGYDTYGIDFSQECINRVPIMFKKYKKTSPKVFCENMLATNFNDNFFDVVVDIFSTHCLTETQYESFIQELNRISKPDALFFSYTPSKGSGAFKSYSPAILIDNSTLNGIHRKDSPFYGNSYPFRFSSVEYIETTFEKYGLKIEYLEVLSRSYSKRKEIFEFLIIQAQMQKKLN